jgi:hypothetical protein
MIGVVWIYLWVESLGGFVGVLGWVPLKQNTKIKIIVK